MNIFGNKFRLAIFGESHGAAIGVTIDGVEAGIALTQADFTADLARRAAGAAGTTPRKESDMPHIISGVFDGHTTGAPLTIIFNNENTLSGDYRNLLSHPRPSHADFTARAKWGGNNDPRGGGHFSGRLTLAIVAAGVVAKKMLPSSIKIEAKLVEIGGQKDGWAELIDATLKAQNSIGGVVECTASGVAVGVGSPFFDSFESRLSHLAFSIPAVRGVEFGAGFAAAAMRGSEHNDPILNADGTTATNNAGGVVGGITNGNDIVFRVAIKPTSSISHPQQTYNFDTGKVEQLIIKGRHDACIALRTPVIFEAVTAITLIDMM